MPSILYCLLFTLFIAFSTIQAGQKKSPIDELKNYLSQDGASLPELKKQSFSKRTLSKKEAHQATQILAKARIAELQKKRKKEFDAKSITIGDKTLKYDYLTYGEEPKGGHSLYISMHGGGGAPARVNDSQWANQIKLYQPKEGIYVAPRAPTDTWDLWHLPHVDPLFDRLIENFIAIKNINPNKVYIMGYSAGGDGTYQLAPRMADRWAGAAMMAGHPGDAQTYNLRNLPYFIQCGGKDAAYKRNQWCKAWGERLDKLAKSDPGGYPHRWIVYPEYGHWMMLKCKQALPWMAKYTRNPWPKKLHWYQDNVTHQRFYWLANNDPKPKQLITAEVQGQTITLTTPNKNQHITPPTLDESKKENFTPLHSIILRLSDNLLDLDKAVTIKNANGKVLFQGAISRNIEALTSSIIQRPDSSSVASALLALSL